MAPSVRSNVTRLREERGWTKTKLADESGVTFQTISYIEHGHVDPRLETAQKLARALGVKMSELLD